MSAVLDEADAIVLVASPAIDAARSAFATLDWLEHHGRGHLVPNATVVIERRGPGSRRGVGQAGRAVPHPDSRGPRDPVRRPPGPGLRDCPGFDGQSHPSGVPGIGGVHRRPGARQADGSDLARAESLAPSTARAATIATGFTLVAAVRGCWPTNSTVLGTLYGARRPLAYSITCRSVIGPAACTSCVHPAAPTAGRPGR